MKLYYVYILASLRRVLYIGVTGNLENRLAYHRFAENPNSFTARYGITRLVYLEEFTDVNQAIAREKQLKSWRRAKKIRLIQESNPHWVELAPSGAPPAHTDPSLRSG
jgi:putative endonuclease